MTAFFVAGLPVPQGSMKARVLRLPGGKLRAVMYTDNKRLAPWRKLVAARAGVVLGHRPVMGPVALQVVFVLPRPASVRRETPAVKPDLDKLLRAVMDALTTAGSWEDDARVVSVSMSKVYGVTPGVHVVLEPVPSGSAYGPAVPLALNWETRE